MGVAWYHPLSHRSACLELDASLRISPRDSLGEGDDAEQGASREEKQFFALEHEEIRIYPFSAALSGKYVTCGVSSAASEAYQGLPRMYISGAKANINEFAMVVEWFLLQAFGLPFSLGPSPLCPRLAVLRPLKAFRALL